MEQAMAKLEQQRRKVIKRIGNLGELRRGTVLESATKCGKRNCRCMKKGEKGHIRYIWNATIKGKAKSRNLKLGAEMEKYHQETGNYREFMKYCSEYVELSEKLADLQPIREIGDLDELAQLKKKLQRIYRKNLRQKSNG